MQFPISRYARCFYSIDFAGGDTTRQSNANFTNDQINSSRSLRAFGYVRCVTTTGAAPKVMFVTGHPDHRLVDRRVVAGARTRGVCCGFVAMLMRCDCCRWLLETTLLRETTPRLRLFDLLISSTSPSLLLPRFFEFLRAQGVYYAHKKHIHERKRARWLEDNHRGKICQTGIKEHELRDSRTIGRQGWHPPSESRIAIESQQEGGSLTPLRRVSE